MKLPLPISTTERRVRSYFPSEKLQSVVDFVVQ